MPIYVVTNTASTATATKETLVQAANKAAAIRHVVAPQFGAHLADQATLVRMLQAGAKIETPAEVEAGAE